MDEKSCGRFYFPELVVAQVDLSGCLFIQSKMNFVSVLDLGVRKISGCPNVASVFGNPPNWHPRRIFSGMTLF